MLPKFNAAERLSDLGAPVNIFTRLSYRAGYLTLYIPMYFGLKTAAFCMRKDPLELVMEIADKLDLDIDNPTK